MTPTQIIALVVLLLGCLILYLIGPSKCTAEKKMKFYGRNYAHRGLHTRDYAIPENSLAAFAAAAERGYGVELDVHLSRDGEVMVFHDDKLERVCGVPGTIKEKDAAELQTISLRGTEQTIPTLKQVFAVINKRVPIIIELKNGNRGRELCEKTCALIKEYGGDCAVQSFDPNLVAWFNRHACSILRGQLMCCVPDYKGEVSKFAAFLLGNALTNFLSRPNYLAHELGPKSPGARFAEWLGAGRFCWTARDPEAAAKLQQENDSVIFEFYEPKPRYWSYGITPERRL